MNTPTKIVIATRQSRLALWQAEHVKAMLESRGATVTLLGITTKGDQILDRTLSRVGGKGLFVKELEAAILERRADLAVHSLKDVPMEFPAGLGLACVMQREDPLDAWVSPRYARLQDLPQGAVVGTASLRRTVLLKALRPDLEIQPLRGNLDTRLSKLDAGSYAGIVLAAVGLKRLGYHTRIRHVFSSEEILPAAGQGALGLEIANEDTGLQTLLTSLNDVKTLLTTTAERAVGKTLGGSCSMPLAAFAQWQKNGDFFLRALYGDLGSGVIYRASASTAALSSVAQAQSLGESVAQNLMRQGVVPAI